MKIKIDSYRDKRTCIITKILSVDHNKISQSAQDVFRHKSVALLNKLLK